jgi:hypothetical protein
MAFKTTDIIVPLSFFFPNFTVQLRLARTEKLREYDMLCVLSNEVGD